MFVTQHQYSYGHLQILTQQHKIWVTQRIHFQLRLNKAILLPSCFSSHTANVCCFCGLFSTIFFAFWCFPPLWFHCLKWPSRILLKFFLVFQSVSKLSCALQRKYMWFDKLHFSAVVFEFIVNEGQQYF